MIEIKNLNKSFNSQVVFKDFSLKLEEKKITAIMGKSGTGKTTLLRILGKLDKDFQGEIINQPLNASWVFQEDRLLPWLNVYDNISLILEDNKKKQDTDIIEILERLGLKSDLNKKPDELSGGMKRRVAIARALISGKDVIFLDEPFVGLDNKMKMEIAGDLFDLARKKEMTVIMVTHDSELASLCDNVISIDR